MRGSDLSDLSPKNVTAFGGKKAPVKQQSRDHDLVGVLIAAKWLGIADILIYGDAKGIID